MSEFKSAGAQFITVDGKYRVWTKRVGDSPIKVLTLHGGPGACHLYFECFEDFLPQAGIEFYYYDQLGSLFSDNPDDPSLWTIERFCDEVEQVRLALGLDQFILYGQSWGGMLAIEYALKYQEHLKAVVISNMTASIPCYVDYLNELRRKFPEEVQRTLEKYEAAGDYEAPEYQEAMYKQLYGAHLCRLDPYPAPVDLSFRFLNPRIYNHMQGPNEFVVTGTFKDWDRWADLPEIHVPALVMAAKHDTMSPEELGRMAKLMPNGRLAFCPNGSHLAMWDDQEVYFRELIAFLKS